MTLAVLRIEAPGTASQRVVVVRMGENTAMAVDAARRAEATLPSANTLALIDAVREFGSFERPVSHADAADVPTLTLGASFAVSTLTAAPPHTPSIDYTDDRLTFLSGVPMLVGAGYPGGFFVTSRGAYEGAANGGGDPLRTSYFLSFEFNHTGDTFDLAYKGGGGGKLRILVDGIAVITHTEAADGLYCLLVEFGSSRLRRITIEANGPSFAGINVASDGEVTATGRANPLMTVLGDSLIAPTGVATGEGYLGQAAVMGRALGFSTAVAGVGSTGMMNPGVNNTAGFPRVNWQNATRLLDLTLSGVTSAQTGGAISPDIGVVFGSQNDGNVPDTMWNGAANLEAATFDAAWVLIEAWLAANPGKPLVFFGPSWLNATPLPSVYLYRDGIQRACQAAYSSGVRFIDRLGSAPLQRSGVFAYITTTGTTTNASKVVSAIPSTYGIVEGALVQGAGVPDGITVVSVDSGTQVTLSDQATATAAGVTLLFRNSQADLYASLLFGDTAHPGPRGHLRDGLDQAEQLRRLILGELP